MVLSVQTLRAAWGSDWGGSTLLVFTLGGLVVVPVLCIVTPRTGTAQSLDMSDVHVVSSTVWEFVVVALKVQRTKRASTHKTDDKPNQHFCRRPCC